MAITQNPRQGRVGLSSLLTKKSVTRYMKKIAKLLLSVACFAGIILAGCEEPDGSCNIIWTLSWMGVALLSGLGLKKMEGAK